MFFEARSEGGVGQHAVARNILKRMDLGHRGAKTICDVVRAPKQYSYLWDGHIHVVLQQELELYNEIYRSSELFLKLAAEDKLPEYSIGECKGGGTHYHTTAVNPSWSHPVTGSMKKICGQIGNHIFYDGN